MCTFIIDKHGSWVGNIKKNCLGFFIHQTFDAKYALTLAGYFNLPESSMFQHFGVYFLNAMIFKVFLVQGTTVKVGGIAHSLRGKRNP